MAYQYPVPAIGSIILTTFRMTYCNQRLMNTFHWRLTANSGGLTVEGVANQLNAYFGTATTGLYDLHCALRDVQCVLDDAQIQFIHPQRFVALGYVLNKPGTAPVGEIGMEVPNVACVLTRRAVVGTRRGVSSLHIPIGLSAAQVDEGTIDPAAQTKIAAIGNSILNTGAVGNGVSVEPVIYHRGAEPVYDVIGSFIVQDTLRVMRRRTVRVGI